MFVVLLCSQLSSITTASMASFSALNTSVLQDKGVACIVAGSTLALATSLTAGMYCYWSKSAYAKQEKALADSSAHLTKLIQEKEEMLKKKKAEGERNSLLLSLILIKTAAQDADYSKAHNKTLNKEILQVDSQAVVEVWQEESNAHQDMPIQIKLHIEGLSEELSSLNPGRRVFYGAIDAITASDWYRSLEKIGATIDKEIEKVENEVSSLKNQPTMPAPKAPSWSTLFRGMGLGYLSSLGLILYGLCQGQKA